MLKQVHEKWLKVCVQIRDELPERSLKTCPVCGEIAVDFQYVGNEASRIGFMCAWCNCCKNGIHISRLIIPKNATFMPFNTPNEELEKRIPKFKPI